MRVKRKIHVLCVRLNVCIACVRRLHVNAEATFACP